VSVLYVAEMGSQHKGNIALACRYAYELKAAGADILKMQFGWPAGDPIRHVSEQMAEQMAAYCDRLGLELMASIFDFGGLELARSIGMKRYKIAHQKAGDEPLVASILAERKETFLAGTDLEHFLVGDGIRNIFTTDRYPTYDLALPAKFDIWYGYSDHTIGLGACLLAVARGARYIEKHVALDPTDLWTKDTAFSATPAQFAELVRLGREIERVRDAAV
jgi:N,N'-diacetyllegionaminate synthase